MLRKELIRIQVDNVQIEAMLNLPPSAKGIIIFAHGSGSNRLSPRNNFVADALHGAGMGTLLVDLLTPNEDRDYDNRFNIPLLTQRLDAAVQKLTCYELTSACSVGLFGASTGAAAALQVGAERRTGIAAIISRGGRPDLAGTNALSTVRAPTLLIVGGLDGEVISLNMDAYNVMRCEKRIEIIPGATHLFEEPGKLAEVARLTCNWFERHLF